MSGRDLVAFGARNPMYVLAAVVAGLVMLTMFRRTARAAVGAVRRQHGQRRTEGQSRRAENALTLVAAGIATAVQATGMWKFFGNVLDFSGPLRVLLFAFIELAVFTSALRARNNVRELGSAGVDGIAVWALTGLSAVLATSDAASFPEGIFRMSAPLVAAWLWERGLSVERRRRTGRRIHWRITPERILVRWGIAEASDRTASDVDAHRRLSRVSRAAHQLRELQMDGVTGRRLRRARRRLNAAMDAADEHAALATNPDRHAALLAQLGARFHATGLADLTPDAPWAHALRSHVNGTGPDRTTVREAGELDRTELPAIIAGADFRRAVRPDEPTADDAPERTSVRRDRTGTAHIASRGPQQLDKETVVAEMAAEFREFVTAGHEGRWIPNWDAWMRRTGRSKSYFEKCARVARERVFDATGRTDTTPPDRTADGEQDRTAAVHADDRTAVGETSEDRTDGGLVEAGELS